MKIAACFGFPNAILKKFGYNIDDNDCRKEGMQMKAWMRLAAILFVALCILLIIFLARWYFFSLLDHFGDESESVGISLPMPIVLFFGGAVAVAFLFSALILLRSFAKIRRREAEFDEEEDGDAF